MRTILTNPYRIIGLLVGATAPEQRRQLTRLQRFIEAEQEPDDDFSFPALGKIERTIESVNDAASKLNLDSDKMSAALFWFYKGNDITDEAAFDAIKDGDVDEAFNIWSKLTASGEVTQRNASAFCNLATLYLSGAMSKKALSERVLDYGVSLKLKFLESELVKEFKELTTDETYKTSKKKLQLVFLNQLQIEVEKAGGISAGKFIEILSKYSFAAKEEFLKEFAQKPIELIEKKIEESKAKRKANKANSLNVGSSLYLQTSDSLLQLKSILGVSNLRYTSISDKVSDELLQCGIEYFLHYRDTEEDPSNYAMEMFRKAKSLALGNIAVQRCQDNTENLQKWIDGKFERNRIKKIKNDYHALDRLMDDYEAKEQTTDNAVRLITVAQPYLTRVKSALGATDTLYLDMSSGIASLAQSICVSDLNSMQDLFAQTTDAGLRTRLVILLQHKVGEAWQVTSTIMSMDLRPDFRERANKNRDSLSRLRNQLSPTTGSSGRPDDGSGGGGCYIATMAYGDYEHPQVIELRKFRDNVLATTIAGRLFIKLYYFVSPQLVVLLKNQAGVNAIIRKALNKFIKHLH